MRSVESPTTTSQRPRKQASLDARGRGTGCRPERLMISTAVAPAPGRRGSVTRGRVATSLSSSNWKRGAVVRASMKSSCGGTASPKTGSTRPSETRLTCPLYAVCPPCWCKFGWQLSNQAQYPRSRERET
eukprot:7244769-Prymnesium_polylepis.2